MESSTHSQEDNTTSSSNNNHHPELLQPVVEESGLVATAKANANAQDNTSKIDQLTEQLSQVALKQKRLLSPDTHAYEHFSLPATRVCI